MPTQPVITFDLDLIAARVAALGLDDAAFARRSGLVLAELDQYLTPETTTIAALADLAHLLQVGLEELLCYSHDDTDTSTSSGTGAAADLARRLPAAPLRTWPPRPAAELGSGGDIAVLEDALAEYERLDIDELTELLDWDAERLNAALDGLSDQLSCTPLRLVRAAGAIALIRNPSLLADAARTELIAWQKAGAPLDPHQAHELLHLIHAQLLAPLGVPGPPDSPMMFSGVRRMCRRELTERRLIGPAGPRTLFTRPAPTPDDDSDGDGDGAGGEVRVHPEVLFALQLGPAPAAAPLLPVEHTLRWI